MASEALRLALGETLVAAGGGARDPVPLAQMSGNFPGSPADLLFVFGINGDQITSLEIRNPVQ